ncbi:histidine kinase dimerization/phosphoacceptor domain -containing protein [Reichenbachiella agariperforans]|nr:histidine kinase dimerization/phosphoacceptor domain -containing protein [Reichenbachiella agariperforans]
MQKLTYITVFLSLICFPIFSQNKLTINEEGLPPIQHYSSDTYQGNDQVWDIIQDDRGLIYISTTSSLNEFDGETWRSIPIQSGQIGFSFTKTESNRIYLCGWDMIGYLAPDASGLMRFQSLKEKLPTDLHFGVLGLVKSYGSKIAFSGSESVLIYDETTKTFLYENTDQVSNALFLMDGTINFHVRGKGLVQLDADTLSATPRGDYFRDIVVSGAVQIDESAVLISTYYQGIYYHSVDTTYEIEALNMPYYKSKYPNSVFKISDAYYGITLLQGGLIIVNDKFEPVIHLDKSNGLTNEVYRGFVDASDNLWLGSNEGLFRVDISSAHSIIDTRLGVEGNVLDAKIIDDQIYVGTSQGIYSRPWRPTAADEIKLKNRAFSRVKNSELYNEMMLGGKKQILTKSGGTTGVIEEDEYKVLLTQRSDQAYALTYLRDSAFAITSGVSGKYVELFEYTNSKWTHRKTLFSDSLPDSALKFRYDAKSGRIWGANLKHIFSFNINSSMDSIISYKQYTVKDGIPDEEPPMLNWIDSEIGFGAKGGFYRFDSSREQLVKSSIFQDVFDDVQLVTLTKESDAVYWYSSDHYKKGRVQFTEQGHATLDSGVCNVLEGNNQWIEYVEGFGALVAGSTGLYIIPKGKEVNSAFNFDPLIRRVKVIANMDSTIFNGVYMDDDPQPVTLHPSMNAFRFEVSAPYYRYADQNLYAFKLEPFDEEWTQWTDLNQKEYTNLSPGQYTFSVKARNAFFDESAVAKFEFVVETPWYQTLWIYGLYLLLLIGLIYLIVGWNTKRLKQENVKLEGIIEERTSEIRNQKNIIEKALLERESLLKEIHHRVKNNLQIIASLLYLQSGKFEDEDFKKVLEEGQGRVRSMALIHQKLYENDDLKSIPFGEYLQELVGEIRASFGMKNVQLNIKADNVFFDVDTAVPLGLIVNEIATNAFKYAFDEKGTGSFSIFLSKENGTYILNIKDDGKGLPSEIDIRKTKSLGLRLVRMLSQQLEGEFNFETHNGTSFKLEFAA